MYIWVSKKYFIMSTTATITIRTSSNKNSLHRVIIRVIHNRQNSAIATDIFVDDPENWNEQKSCIKSKCRLYNNIALVNSILADKLSDVRSKIMDLEKSGTLSSMSVKSLMLHLNPRKSNIYVIEVLRRMHQSFIESGRISTAKGYHYTIKFLEAHNQQMLTYSELTDKKLEELSRLHKSGSKSGNGNGFKGYLAALQFSYRYALENGILADNNSNLISFRYSSRKTPKRAINIDYIKKLVALECSPGSMNYHAKNIFIFMYLQGGINIKDLLHLQIKNVVDGRLRFVRHKTGKQFDMPLAPRSFEIFHEYSINKNNDDYIFPVLEIRYEKEPEKTEYYWKMYLRVYRALINLGNAIGLQGNLTSYISRHSWASHARDANVPMAAIQGGLGHSNQRTTEIYLNEISTNISDQAFKTISDNLG